MFIQNKQKTFLKILFSFKFLKEGSYQNHILFSRLELDGEHLRFNLRSPFDLLFGLPKTETITTELETIDN